MAATAFEVARSFDFNAAFFIYIMYCVMSVGCCVFMCVMMF